MSVVASLQGVRRRSLEQRGRVFRTECEAIAGKYRARKINEKTRGKYLAKAVCTSLLIEGDAPWVHLATKEYEPNEVFLVVRRMICEGCEGARAESELLGRLRAKREDGQLDFNTEAQRDGGTV